MSTGEMQHERGYMLVFFCVSVPQATISRVPCTQMNGIWPKALMKNRFSWVLGLQYELHKPVLKKCLVLTMASRITVSCWFQGNIISLLVVKGGGWVLGLIKQCCCSCELLKWAGALEVLAMDISDLSPQTALPELAGSPYACPFVKSILTQIEKEQSFSWCTGRARGRRRMWKECWLQCPVAGPSRLPSMHATCL